MLIKKIYVMLRTFLYNDKKSNKFFRKKGAVVHDSLRCNGMPTIILHQEKSLVLGKDVSINSDSISNPIGYSNPASFWTLGEGRIYIGNHVGMSNTALVAYNATITIEDDVLLGGGVKIYTTNFHALDYESRIQAEDPNILCADVTIKKGVFLGAGVIVLKGVTIGEKSIVGAGSVVTKSIPDGEIWAGNPAKFIRKV